MANTTGGLGKIVLDDHSMFPYLHVVPHHFIGQSASVLSFEHLLVEERLERGKQLPSHNHPFTTDGTYITDNNSNSRLQRNTCQWQKRSKPFFGAILWSHFPSAVQKHMVATLLWNATLSKGYVVRGNAVDTHMSNADATVDGEGGGQSLIKVVEPRAIHFVHQLSNANNIWKKKKVWMREVSETGGKPGKMKSKSKKERERHGDRERRRKREKDMGIEREGERERKTWGSREKEKAHLHWYL